MLSQQLSESNTRSMELIKQSAKLVLQVLLRLGRPFKAIRSGEIDIAICGGAEYMNDEYGAVYKSFDIARTLAIPNDDIHQANCPFDKNHSGFLFSEGGGGHYNFRNRGKCQSSSGNNHCQSNRRVRIFLMHIL